VKAVNVLVELGAHKEAENDDGETPLRVAAERQQSGSWR
jgi:hypothetical protein